MVKNANRGSFSSQTNIQNAKIRIHAISLYCLHYDTLYRRWQDSAIRLRSYQSTMMRCLTFCTFIKLTNVYFSSQQPDNSNCPPETLSVSDSVLRSYKEVFARGSPPLLPRDSSIVDHAKTLARYCKNKLVIFVKLSKERKKEIKQCKERKKKQKTIYCTENTASV